MPYFTYLTYTKLTRLPFLDVDELTLKLLEERVQIMGCIAFDVTLAILNKRKLKARLMKSSTGLGLVVHCNESLYLAGVPDEYSFIECFSYCKELNKQAHEYHFRSRKVALPSCRKQRLNLPEAAKIQQPTELQLKEEHDLAVEELKQLKVKLRDIYSNITALPFIDLK